MTDSFKARAQLAVGQRSYEICSFAALREFVTLLDTRRGDHWAVAAAFFVVLPLNKLAAKRAKEEEPAPEEKSEESLLLTEIRDILAKRA